MLGLKVNGDHEGSTSISSWIYTTEDVKNYNADYTDQKIKRLTLVRNNRISSFFSPFQEIHYGTYQLQPEQKNQAYHTRKLAENPNFFYPRILSEVASNLPETAVIHPVLAPIGTQLYLNRGKRGTNGNRDREEVFARSEGCNAPV